jgi:hypothetical protein
MAVVNQQIHMAIRKRTQFLLQLTAVIGLHLLPTISMAQTPNRADLDRDGIPNMTDRDIDNVAILDGLNRNIDGGTARSGLLRGSSMTVSSILFSF